MQFVRFQVHRCCLLLLNLLILFVFLLSFFWFQSNHLQLNTITKKILAAWKLPNKPAVSFTDQSIRLTQKWRNFHLIAQWSNTIQKMRHRLSAWERIDKRSVSLSNGMGNALSDFCLAKFWRLVKLSCGILSYLSLNSFSFHFHQIDRRIWSIGMRQFLSLVVCFQTTHW